MFLKRLQIFFLFLFIGLCEMSFKDQYDKDSIRNLCELNEKRGLCEGNIEHFYEVNSIRQDYCEDYCDKKCKETNSSETDKTCIITGNTVTTDKYNINLYKYIPQQIRQIAAYLSSYNIFTKTKYGTKVSITWKTKRINLKQLKKLSTLPSKLKVLCLEIEFTETVPEDIPVRITQYMKVLNLNYVEKSYINKSGNVEIFEFRVFVPSGPKITWISCYNHSQPLDMSAVLNNYLSEKMNNLLRMDIWCPGVFALRNDTFQHNTQLEKIVFDHSTLQNLNSVVFENLTNLNDLQLYNCTLDSSEFLRSNSLRNNLKNLHLCNDKKTDIKHVKSYKNLKMIFVNYQDKSYYSQQLNHTNQTAFVCSGNSLADPCYFNLGINGKRCPTACICGLKIVFKHEFMINCTRQGLRNIPELPIPSVGEAYLFFESNGLTQLPNTWLEGYDNLIELHLANNNLTTIQINQLPRNLKWLDLRNNNIISFDPSVAKYLLDRKDNITLLQSGVYWKCNCNNTKLLNLLDVLEKKDKIKIQKINDNFSKFVEEIDNPVHLYHLKGPCPVLCTCCVNGTDANQFIINCTSQNLSNFPVLPNNIVGYTSLLADNNNIETISTTSLRNSTLKEIHLRKNNLTHLHLDQLPSDLRVLDIRQNNFTGLDNKVTEFISNLNKIQLAENPWQCDCKFTKFLVHLRKVSFSEYQVALRRCSGLEYCPDPCICCKEVESQKFIINCSNLGLMEIPEKLPIMENASLLFEHNRLQSLNKSAKIDGFDQLKELHLRYNNITKLEILPENIQFLDIRNNSLKTLSENLTEYLTRKSNMSNLTIFISGNNWTCHCKEILFFRFTKNLAEYIKDLCKTECHDSKLLVSLEEKDLCPEKIPRYVICFTSFILLSCLLSILQYFWKSIPMWLYDKRLFLKLSTRLEKGTETKYDCFLAYCHKDSHFVTEYVDRLEHGRNRLRLCFYERDWLAGEPIPDCICHSVENSKCIVILMTKNFLKSVWGRLEFRLALHATSKDQYKRLIVIIYPGVENFDNLDGELQSYLKLNTYLMRNDVNFWSKLTYALPHKMIDEDEEIDIVDFQS